MTSGVGPLYYALGLARGVIDTPYKDFGGRGVIDTPYKDFGKLQ